ncbi:uncharacterized protein PF11_0213 isoform X4 [Aphidius gifuensis]|uniref:uncharacterized protein PF11_0213 isoform X4 n=1 Tax=Aphidius gifuensis TaxID=684658 RepID=UPI001CDCC884|nr:uncharacterized protein PF11_0213 isoform X4 [Aphidius gifuensis]
MAELITKKSTNIVSNKNNDVCSVKSNNGLIDIDNTTPSNNFIMKKLCEDEDNNENVDVDDLILTNNTINELNNDEKSLQELIENELALRICTDDDEEEEVDQDQDDQDDNCKPSVTTIKKIILEPHQDLTDINTKFINNEINNYDIVDESFNFSINNNHETDDVKLNQNNSIEQVINDNNLAIDNETNDDDVVDVAVNGEINNQKINISSQDLELQQTTSIDDDENIIENNKKLIQDDDDDDDDEEKINFLQVDVDKSDGNVFVVEYNEDIKNSDITQENDKHQQDQPDAWLDPVTLTVNQQQTGEFSDDFTENIDNEKITQVIDLINDDKKNINIFNNITVDIDKTSLTNNNNNNNENIFIEKNNNDYEIIIKENDTDEIKEIDDTNENLKKQNDDNFSSLANNEIDPIVKNDIYNKSQNEQSNSMSCNNSNNNINNNSNNNNIDIDFEFKKTNNLLLISNNTEITDVTADNDTAIYSASIDNLRDKCLSNIIAPLATPDDETSSDLSNLCEISEIHEEVITSNTVTSSVSKTSTKTKKKKIDGVAGNDASQTTPKIKKTKKSKKSELEKENISVTQCYVSETSRDENGKSNKEVIETGVSIKQLCRSFGDISNAEEVEKTTIENVKQTMDTQEKAKSMDDLSIYGRKSKMFSIDASVFARVSVTALRASYCSLANLTKTIEHDEHHKYLKFEKSSFNKFDALTKKSVLHVRLGDGTKSQQQLNMVGQNGDANPNCRSCGKVVFQMEQMKAEGLVFHKNCFRCSVCSKQLNVDNYESNECILYCKAHFKELFQPKPVEESDQPVRPRKPEMIIRENEPEELPPDVVRASDKPDLGLEELSSLNVKSRFQVFEKSKNDINNDIERSPSQVAVKRSPSILSKLAKFQAKGMDIGVADESLNGIPYEESSESEDDEDQEDTDETDGDIVKSKRSSRERPMSFSKMDDIKNRWEVTSQQGRRETQREARKEEIAGIRSRLFMGKQGKMKEMYQQAVAESEKQQKINAVEEIQHSTHARSIKEKFERGEIVTASDDEIDNKPKAEKPDEEVIAAGISRKSRSLFLELDATAAKTGRPVTPVNLKTPTDSSKRAKDAFMARQVSDDVIRSTDTTAEIQVETTDISNKFKFFETYKEPEKERKQFRITPPRDTKDKVNSPEREIYRDPDVIRADDRVDEVVHTDTARKMLSIFRQMEVNASKEDLPDGPKPLKRFTPPPEDKFAKPSGSDTEEDEDDGEESADDDSTEDKDPNYVRASDKVEDEFLKQSQNADKAKTLRAKFEQWETTDGKTTSHHIAEMDLAQDGGEQASIESARSLRARFESLGSTPAETTPRTAKVKVNRFVEIQTACTDICESCEKKVYPLEKVETNNKIFHKQCFRCLQCNCVLRMDTFTLNNGKLYCIPHFKQLFITRGNYDEGFGVDPHKNKWATNGNSTSAAVINGGATPVVQQV